MIVYGVNITVFFQICRQDLAEPVDQPDFLALGHCVADHGMFFLCINYLILYLIERLPLI